MRARPKPAPAPRVSTAMGLALCVAAGLCTPAAAAGPAVPVFAGTAVRGAVATDTAAAVSEELRRLFAERGARVIVQAEKKTVAQAQTRALTEMDARLDDAARAFADGDLPEAHNAVLDALVIFEEALAYAEDDAAWARYREALALQATVRWKAKDKKGADAALLQLLAVEPEWRAKKGALPPELVQRLDLLRDEARATPPAPLEIKSRPAGARVVVDGRRAGRAPVAVDVAPGVHYVLVEDNGRVHRERVVIPEQGARVSARLGSPEQEAAAALVRRLRAPATTKRELLELAYDVADVTVAAVVLPWGQSAQVLCARVVEGELDAVIGARLPLSEARREQALFELVDAALTKPRDAWIGDGPTNGATDTAALRGAFLTGQGDASATVDEQADVPMPLIVGGVVGGLVLAAGIAVGVGAYLVAEGKKDQGFTYTIDGSGLE